MSDGALLLLALLAAMAGMASLALSIEAHWRQVMGPRTRAEGLRRKLRSAGAALLALSFLPCVRADPLSMAVLVWPMLLTIAAVAVAASLALHGRLSRHAG